MHGPFPKRIEEREGVVGKIVLLPGNIAAAALQGQVPSAAAVAAPPDPAAEALLEHSRADHRKAFF